jgi:hypothetical protein
MADNVRLFQAGPDPFGRTWDVEFRWAQNAISIRHADTVDVKYVLRTAGEEPQEKVIALPHTELLALSAKSGHALTDGWCMKLAANHVKYMVKSGDDVEKTLVTVTPAELERAAGIHQAA